MDNKLEFEIDVNVDKAIDKFEYLWLLIRQLRKQGISKRNLNRIIKTMFKGE